MNRLATEYDILDAAIGAIHREAGYESDTHKIHRLTCEDEESLPWEIDIVPFGDIEDGKNSVHWPPDQDFAMNVLGFSGAFAHAFDVQISEDPAIVCLLKLVSWLDRGVELRAKDATDFSYLIQSYSKIPEIFDALLWRRLYGGSGVGRIQGQYHEAGRGHR